MRLILTDKCIAGMVVAKTIQRADGTILINQGMELKKRYIDKMKEIGVKHIYIKDESFCQFVIQDSVKEETRQEAIELVHKQMSSISNYNSLEAIQLELVVKDMINQLLSTDSLITNLTEIRSINDYTFGHSVNVGILSIITGISIDFSKDTLLELGLGAILHDIGKTRVSMKVLNKPGRLTDEEYNEIKKHTLIGFDIIQNSEKLDESISFIALNHHERYDGKGYPNRLKGEDIPLFSRIVSVADVYDALTNDRVYRAKLKKNQAIEYITSTTDKQFDPEIVDKLMSRISVYSIGEGILLSTGQKGYIISIDAQAPTRPTVRITHNENGKNLQKRYNIDLVRKTNIKIVDTIEIDDV